MLRLFIGRFRKRYYKLWIFLICLSLYIHYRSHRKTIVEPKTTLTTTAPNSTHSTQQFSTKEDHPTDLIRTILEDEYNRDDLQTFYDLVETKLSSDLPCVIGARTTASNISIATNQSNRSHVEPIVPKTNPMVMSLVQSSQRRIVNTYVIDNQDACVNKSIDLLIMVISKPGNYKTRDAIRRTWGSGINLGNYSSIRIKLFFLTDLDETLSTNIGLENKLFHDIIQVELPAQYTLVTYRVLSLFEWSFRFCRSAKFLFKTDDDIFINLILLLKFVKPLLSKPMNDSFTISNMIMYGFKHSSSPVVRKSHDSVSAHYVITMDEFPCSQYPDFLSGFGYLLPKMTRDAIVYTAYRDKRPLFRISDVYFTGILPAYLSISRERMLKYNIIDFGNCEGFIRNLVNTLACSTATHIGGSKDIFELFNQNWQHAKKLISD